ncbi:cora-like Mg2+ transporter protein-domain-containing protein [Amylocystis lapponica]|nr:cora-like Mg2+ transporter protein-domain-containing protein [Amylocystis lapponica]
MPRENSFSDEGRSLTPDLDDMIAREAESKAEEAAEKAHARKGGPSLENINVSFSAPSVLDQPPRTPAVNGPQRPSFITPADRFRSTVRRVMALHRTSSIMARRGIGAEPGIDPRRASANLNYGNIKQQCIIEVADYSTMRSSFGRMTNRELINLLRDPSASRKEPWVKVRWINVGGISWDVISALALKYDMHPLALEDLLHQRGNARSKADYYPKHLFLRVLRHSLVADDDINTPDPSMTDLPRSDSPEFMTGDDSDEEDSSGPSKEKDGDDERTMYGSASGSRFSTARTRGGTLKARFQGAVRDVESHPMRAQEPQKFGNVEDRKKSNARNVKLIRELKKGDRVNVRSSQCVSSSSGTALSSRSIGAHESSDTNIDFTQPIMDRLRQRDTGLRTTADPSLLVESLLDLIVDQALEVIEEYQGKILKIEQAVLVKPGDLILHKRTLEPLKTVIYGLRRYDEDRVAALSERIDPKVKVEGYMSHKSKIYLADVHDHMEYILTSLDMFAGVSENLINYTFNMASYEMNEVMRRLTLATIIFLPLTLLTGYFGMNFENMWSIMHGHSDVVFWIIALPLMALVVPLFLWSDVHNMAHYIQKRMIKEKVKKSYKRA